MASSFHSMISGPVVFYWNLMEFQMKFSINHGGRVLHALIARSLITQSPVNWFHLELSQERRGCSCAVLSSTVRSKEHRRRPLLPKPLTHVKCTTTRTTNTLNLGRVHFLLLYMSAAEHAINILYNTFSVAGRKVSGQGRPKAEG